VPVTRFSGRVHRQTGLDTPAFPPDRPAPTEGRYHRPGDPWPLYASLEPATAWAEWSAATGGRIDPGSERRRLWRIDVAGLPVVDLRDADAVTALRASIGQLVGPRGAAQRLARRVRAAGGMGMIVPSAAHPGHWNLVVFPEGFAHVATRGSRSAHPRPPAPTGEGGS
jgi:RES domain-containing protein